MRDTSPDAMQRAIDERAARMAAQAQQQQGDVPRAAQPAQPAPQAANADTQGGQMQEIAIRPYDTISLAELMRMDIPPLEWLVDRILPRGALVLLAAPPKAGKSWFTLDLSLCVGLGVKFLDFDTHKHGVLLMALEDSDRRLRDRSKELNERMEQLQLWSGSEWPSNIYLRYEVVDKLGDGFLARLDATIKKLDDDIQLVIIDTLQMIRGAGGKRNDVYAQDYDALTPLREYANTHNITILAVTHTRKMQDSSDCFNMVTGSIGVTGTVDETMMLLRENRKSPDAVLSITGRDVEMMDLRLRFEHGCHWTNIGDAGDVEEREQREAYDSNPIVQAIRKLTRGKGLDGWTGTAKKLMTDGQAVTGMRLAGSPKGLSTDLHKLFNQLMRYDNIGHKITSNGTGGRTYTFYQFDAVNNIDDDDDLPDDDLDAGFDHDWF